MRLRRQKHHIDASGDNRQAQAERGRDGQQKSLLFPGRRCRKCRREQDQNEHKAWHNDGQPHPESRRAETPER